MDYADTLVNRYRLMETVVPLAAEADEQVAYAHLRGNDIDEIVSDFVDWGIGGLLPGAVRDGLIPVDLEVLLRGMGNRLTSVGDPQYPYLECDEAISYPVWGEVRTLARRALEIFRTLGLAVPSIDQGLLGDISTVPDEAFGNRP